MTRASKSRGYLCPTKFRPTGLHPRRVLPKGHARQALTHMVLVTNLPEVQGKLPQVFLANERCVPARLLGALVLQKSQVHIWRGKSSWNDTSKMLRFLALLSETMAQFPSLRPILVMDCAPCHLSMQVALRAQALGIYLLLVPAKCTLFVQPADTHVLGPYKKYVSKLWQKNIARVPGDTCESTAAWLQCLSKACREYLNAKTWTSAFAETGILNVPCNLTATLRFLAPDRLSEDPVPIPSRKAIVGLYPKKAFVPYAALFGLSAKLKIPLLE